MSPFLSVKLDEDDAPYDQAELVSQLRDMFPDIEVKEGDQLELEAQRAESFLLPLDTMSKRAVVESLQRKAARYGPAIAFSVLVQPKLEHLGFGLTD